MSLISVKEEKCVSCGLCGETCPMGLISFDDSRYPQEREGAEGTCVSCGHCVSVCPNGALALAKYDESEFKAVNESLVLKTEHVEQLIKSRRSIRKFKQTKIEKRDFEKLFDIARYAPTGGNSQLVNWIAVNSRDLVKKIGDAAVEHFKNLIVEKHPVTQRYPFEKMIAYYEEGHDFMFRGAPALIITCAPAEYGLGAVDSTIALSYLDLAAASLNIGCCWAGFFMIAASGSEQIRKMLNIPDHFVFTGCLMAGYSDEKYMTIPPRNRAKVTWMD